MTVEEFEEKYNSLHKEGIELYEAMKPLLARLKSLAQRSLSLYRSADNDKGIYRKEKRYLYDGRTEDSWEPDGWNYDLMFRLSDMEWIRDNVRGVSNCLYNLKHTPFRKGRRVNKHDK